jgi:hypothetical protein
VSLSKEIADNHSQENLQRAAEIVASSSRRDPQSSAAEEAQATASLGGIALSSHLWTELLD